MRDSIHCARLLAFVTGLVNQELLLQNEYLAWENRILKAHLPTLVCDSALPTTEGSGLASLWHQLVAELLGRRCQAFDTTFLIPLLIRCCSLVNVWLPPP